MVDDKGVIDLRNVMLHGFQHLEPDEKTYLKLNVLIDNDLTNTDISENAPNLN